VLGKEYVCAECGHRFRTPEGMAHDKRSLMCPGCGSYDLNISEAVYAPPLVMRAKTPAPAGDVWNVRESKLS